MNYWNIDHFSLQEKTPDFLILHHHEYLRPHLVVVADANTRLTALPLLLLSHAGSHSLLVLKRKTLENTDHGNIILELLFTINIIIKQPLS